MTDTIVMIHGMGGGGWCWENYNKYLSKKGYQCFNPTLRFHDMAPNEVPDPKLGTTSLLDYAEDLEKKIHQLNTKPILIGHSMGGLLAQIIGSRGLARALVLLNPAPPHGIMAIHPYATRCFWSTLTKWRFWEKPNHLKFNEAASSILHLLTPEEQKKTFGKLVYESGRAFFEMGFWLFDSKGAAKVDESKITCPVLVVAGAKDRLIPPTVVKKVADKYNTVSTYKEFANHSHWIIGEPGWQETAAYVSEWLNEACQVKSQLPNIKF